MIIGLSFIFRKSEFKQISVVEFIKFSVFPIISISLFIAFLCFGNEREFGSNELKFYSYLSIIFLLSNIYMYWLLKVDVENKIGLEKTRMIDAHAAELSSLYEEIKEEHKEIYSIEHEYKNRMSVITSMVASRNYDELEKYLCDIHISSASTDIVDTGNSIVSAIFNAKYAEAVRKRIQVRFDLDNLSNIKISDSDFVVVLSNLFNNAIEACETYDGEKTIYIKINNLHETLFVDFTNTCNAVDSGNELADYFTTKKDSKHHGYGLKNIRRIVDSYEGQMDIFSDKNRFSIRIIFPNRNS